MWTDNTRKAKIKGDQIEVFQILNGYENIDSNFFFSKLRKVKYLTRGHNYTLVKKQSRLDVRKYSFSQRTINVWNKLSTDCVYASSVNMFKNKIDMYLVKAGYIHTTIGAVCKSVFTLPCSQLDENLPLRSQFYSDNRVNFSTYRSCLSATFGPLTFCVYPLLLRPKIIENYNIAVKTHRTA